MTTVDCGQGISVAVAAVLMGISVIGVAAVAGVFVLTHWLLRKIDP